jgi:hypothetical protein
LDKNKENQEKNPHILLCEAVAAKKNIGIVLHGKEEIPLLMELRQPDIIQSNMIQQKYFRIFLLLFSFLSFFFLVSCRNKFHQDNQTQCTINIHY